MTLVFEWHRIGNGCSNIKPTKMSKPKPNTTQKPAPKPIQPPKPNPNWPSKKPGKPSGPGRGNNT